VRFGGRGPAPAPDPELIRTLARLLTENGLSEIEYAAGDRRIRVVREILGAAPGYAGGGSGASRLTPIPGEASAADHQGILAAPMVGIAYLAPQPGAPPFVRVGDTVVAGQTLLIIEAMKVMNEIGAPRPGRVVKILAADAQPVEYGAVLMLIE
jgi:acetyl-CoA carboxylase biotin carboxyl carrier protein